MKWDQQNHPGLRLGVEQASIQQTVGVQRQGWSLNQAEGTLWYCEILRHNTTLHVTHTQNKHSTGVVVDEHFSAWVPSGKLLNIRLVVQNWGGTFDGCGMMVESELGDNMHPRGGTPIAWVCPSH